MLSVVRSSVASYKKLIDIFWSEIVCSIRRLFNPGRLGSRGNGQNGQQDCSVHLGIVRRVDAVLVRTQYFYTPIVQSYLLTCQEGHAV